MVSASGERHAAERIVRGAVLIAGLTTLSRLLGLIRTLVFSQTIGAGCLGTVYVTAYQVPNLITELVLGGALTSAMVPVLARSAARAFDDRAERARVGEITSALLTWAVVILVPLTVILALIAGPIASALIPANAHAGCARGDLVTTTTQMLEVFAPQVLLYGLSVVLFGLLQAYRRFAGPAVAPVVASLVLIASYLAFVPLDRGLPLSRMPRAASLVLSVGTTLSIGVLVLVAAVPVWRLRLRFRPRLRLPGDVARLAGGMAAVGLIEFICSDMATVVVIALANGRGDRGALVLFNYAWLVFNAVFAVLALSVITSAFPALAVRDGSSFDEVCARSTRGVVLISWLGAAAMAAIAVPAARVLAKQPDQVSQLAAAFLLFAPGVAGFAVVTNVSRVMFALGRLRVAALGLGGSWLLVMALDAVLASLAPARWVVAALALGSTLGQTITAVPMAIAVRRLRGPDAVHGVWPAAAAGLAAGAVGAAVGVAVSVAVSAHGKLVSAGTALLAAACAVLVFAMVGYALDKRDVRTLWRRAADRLVTSRRGG